MTDHEEDLRPPGGALGGADRAHPRRADRVGVQPGQLQEGLRLEHRPRAGAGNPPRPPEDRCGRFCRCRVCRAVGVVAAQEGLQRQARHGASCRDGYRRARAGGRVRPVHSRLLGRRGLPGGDSSDAVHAVRRRGGHRRCDQAASWCASGLQGHARPDLLVGRGRGCGRHGPVPHRVSVTRLGDAGNDWRGGHATCSVTSPLRPPLYSAV